MSQFTKPGAILPNGATVVAARRSGASQLHVVLALTPPGESIHPYVTWLVGEETGMAISGDYCMTFEGAIRSFAARSGFAVETLGGGIAPREDSAKDVTPHKRCKRCGVWIEILSAHQIGDVWVCYPCKVHHDRLEESVRNSGTNREHGASR